jgi:hypothetical protein
VRAPGGAAETARRKSFVTVKGKDVRVDMTGVLREKALTVSSSDLARRHREVQVLDAKTINNLIREAVEDAIENLGKELDGDGRERLLREAEEHFKKKLLSFREEKAGVEARAWKLQHQLERAQELLRDERAKAIQAERFTVSEAGMEDIERRLSRMLDRAIQTGRVDGDLERDMRAVVQGLLDDERKRIKEREEEAQNDRIQLLERKVARLSTTLEETEKARDRARAEAQAFEAAGGAGLRGISRPGLQDADPDRKRKLELLKAIAAENRDMRRILAERGFSVPARSAAGAGAPAAAEKASPAAAPPAATPPAEAVAAQAEETTQVIPAEELVRTRAGEGQ